MEGSEPPPLVVAVTGATTFGLGVLLGEPLFAVLGGVVALLGLRQLNRFGRWPSAPFLALGVAAAAVAVVFPLRSWPPVLAALIVVTAPACGLAAIPRVRDHPAFPTAAGLFVAGYAAVLGVRGLARGQRGAVLAAIALLVGLGRALLERRRSPSTADGGST